MISAVLARTIAAPSQPSPQIHSTSHGSWRTISDAAATARTARGLPGRLWRYAAGAARTIMRAVGTNTNSQVTAAGRIAVGPNTTAATIPQPSIAASARWLAGTITARIHTPVHEVRCG